MGVLRQQEQGLFCYICWAHGIKHVYLVQIRYLEHNLVKSEL